MNDAHARRRVDLDLWRAVQDVAPRLLGAIIRSADVAVRITEVEAYAGEDDPGSHARRGPTPRCDVMFGEPGRAYVYFTYGMHHCLNVVCQPAGSPGAVLLRAGRVIEGEAPARARRAARTARPHRFDDLARGPARLTQALGVRLEHNGIDLSDPRSPVTLSPGPMLSSERVRSGPRVGVRGRGGDGATFPWRYWVADDPTVSTYRPATPRRARRPVPRNMNR